MKKLLNGVFAVILTATVCGAEKENIWEGAYAGVSLGGMMGTATTTEYDGYWDYGEYSMTETAGTLGILTGYNWLIGESGVLGVEADINYSSFDVERKFDSSPEYENTATWNWFSTVRVRGGLAVDKTMLFVGMGLAIVDAEYSFGDTTDPIERAESSGVTLGYTIGAGAEFAMTDSVSIRTEYMYIGLPSDEVKMDGDSGDFVSSANIIRLACIYNF